MVDSDGHIAAPLTTDGLFDVAAYTRQVQGPLALEPLDAPLNPQLHQALRYVHASLTYTNTWLADVLVTATHKDARVTAFLTSWAYEQHWLASAIATLLKEPDPTAAQVAAMSPTGRFAPLRAAVLANVQGRAINTVHMVERLADSWAVEEILAWICELAPGNLAIHLAPLRIVLARQRVFFEQQAVAGLNGSRYARHLTRYRLARLGLPIGAGRSAARRRGMAFDLPDNGQPRLQRVEEQVRALPGLKHVHLRPAY